METASQVDVARRARSAHGAESRLIAGWCTQPETKFTGEKAPAPTTTDEILTAHDCGVKTVKDSLTGIGDAGLPAMWTAKAGGATLMAMPNQALVRALVLNHRNHHRGQLTVYLRLLDVPVPSVYGPSADENPFAART